jgi:hypothetical protein
MAIRSTADYQYRYDSWIQNRLGRPPQTLRQSPPRRLFTESQPVPAYPTERVAIALLPPAEAIPTTSPSLAIGHADPLAPLRPGDSAALEDLFVSDRIQEITLDVLQYLARTYPEPCWEDEPYEFLHGYV